MRFAIVALFAGVCFAQTAVDLAHQAKTPDFSAMQHTRPAQTGTALPGSCSPGEVFFKTDAPPGSNLYLATSGSPCTWTQVNPLAVGGTSGQLQFNNSGSLGGFTVKGDATLAPSTGTLTVTKTNGVAFAPSATTDATNASNITSGTLPAGRMPGLSGDVSSPAGNATVTVGRVNGTSVPLNSAADTLLGTSAVSAGAWFAVPNCQDTAGKHLNYNTTTHTFTCGSTGSGGANPAGNSGDLQFNAGAGLFGGASIPLCLDTLGQHLNYNNSTHTFSCGSSGSGNGLPAGNSGDVQINAGGGLFGTATGQDLGAKIFPTRAYWIDGVKFASIRDAVSRCDSDIGAMNYGTCDIYDWHLPETMNALPWSAAAGNKHTIRLHLGPGVLKICDSGTGTDGLTCTAPFSLATGGAGQIDGVLNSLAIADTGTIVRAGALQTGVPLMVQGQCGNASCTNPTQTNQDTFGARIENLTVDANCNANSYGIENSSAQERSVLRNLHIKNFNKIGLWLTSIRASNALDENLDIIPGPCLTASTIAVLIDNTGSPRPLRGATLNGLNGYSINLAGATFTASSSTISGITVDTSKIAPALGPGSTATYVYINNPGVNGWQGVYQLSASTASSITVTGLSGAVNGTGTGGTVSLIPTYGMVVCSGNCSAYGGSSSGGGQQVQVDGLHLQHFGVGAEVVSTVAQGVVFNQPTGSLDMNTVVQFENNATLRHGVVVGISSGGAPVAINDLIAGTVIYDGYKGLYVTGTAGSGEGAPVQFSAPVALTARAAPGTGVAGAGRGILYFNSTSNRVTINNNNSGDSTVFGSVDFPNCLDSGGQHINYNATAKTFSCGTSGGAGGGMVYPGAGIPVSTGSVWGTSITAGAAGHVIRSNGTSYVDSAIQASDVPLLNQNTTGSAASLSMSSLLPNGMTANTPLQGDNSTKVATTAYVDIGLATKPSYPASGLPVSTGSAWGSSITPGAAGHFVRSNGTSYVDSAIQGSDIPILNQNTTGTAANLSGTPALPNGTTATTQTAGDNSTKLATTAYVDSGLSGKAASTAKVTINGVDCVLGSTCAPTGPAGASGGYEVLKFIFGAYAGVSVAVNDTVQSNPPYRSTTLAGCFAHADTAPAGAALIVDIQVGGTSVFGANPKITINAGSNDASMVTTFANPAISPTSAPKAVVTQVGSTTAGAGVTVVCGTTDSGIVADTDVNLAAGNTKVPTDAAVQAYVAAHGGSSVVADTDVNLAAGNTKVPTDAAVQAYVAAHGTKGLVLLTDTGTNAWAYAASPSGCSSSDLVDGFTFLLRPAHTSGGGTTTFAYCGGTAKNLYLQSGVFPQANDIRASATSTPYVYQIVYHASPIDKFTVMQNLRMGSDTEAGVGTDPTLAVNMPQVISKINLVAPLASNLGFRHQSARTTGSAWIPADTPGTPGSGRAFMEWYANGTTTLETRRFGAATTTGNCGTVSAVAVSSSSPRQVSYPTTSTSVGQYCIISTSAGVTWAGSEEVFDATIDLSQLTNVSYLIGLVDSGHVASNMLSYTSGNYPGGLVAFRFNPGAGDSVTWHTVMARDSSTIPVVVDAGATNATVTGSVVHFQIRLRESAGEAHFLIGPSGGDLTEVSTTGSWGGNMPSGVALSPIIGEYVTGSLGAAPTLGIADVGLEVNAVPGVSLP